MTLERGDMKYAPTRTNFILIYDSSLTYFMTQVLEHKWTFKCHLCKKCCHDPIEIGLHFLTHNYNLISDDELI